MIKKIRKKFIVIAMLAVILVLLVIMGLVNILNYNSMIKDADEIMNLLVGNDGKFPDDTIPDNWMADDFAQNKADLEKMRGNDRISPETPYESRYFTVFLNEKNDIAQADTGKIAAVDTAQAIEYAYEAQDKGKAKGFIDVYRYEIKDSADGQMIVFLDCRRSLETCKSFLFISGGISLAGILVVLILIIICSGRIIKPVAESYEKQKQFITDAGHEIKTPLTIIDADADLLEMEIAEENEWLADIRKQTARLTRLTNDLIYLAHMEESREDVSLIEFPLSDIIEDEVKNFKPLALTRDKSIETDIQPALSIKGNEKYIRQLVGILLDNSMKYSMENSCIDVKLEKKGKNIHFTVSNKTEQDMDSKNLEHMFDRFYRVDPSRNSGKGGHGIGLSIARSIVDLHKGRISSYITEENVLNITVIFSANGRK
jgi:signal transduction histidine kinase